MIALEDGTMLVPCRSKDCDAAAAVRGSPDEVVTEKGKWRYVQPVTRVEIVCWRGHSEPYGIFYEPGLRAELIAARSAARIAA